MPIGVGAEVFDSYGQKCNHRFLLNYGFSVENNVEADGYCPNEVPLLLQLSSVDKLYREKVIILFRAASDKNITSTDIHRSARGGNGMDTCLPDGSV